jgi:polyvinyl alcohol dehydrogenase (cytochrome)
MRIAGLVAVFAAAIALPSLARAQEATPAWTGESMFAAGCKSCHDPAIERAPNRTVLAAMPPAQIVEALTSGVMAPMGSGLSLAQKQAIASYLTAPQAAAARGRPQTPQPGVDVPCATHPPIRASGSDWTSQGFDETSRRYQPNPGLSAKDVPHLKLKWAFAMSGGGMPTVVGDWLFVTNRNGRFYALDARSGCVHWMVDGAGSRTTPMVIRSGVSPSGWATFIGERSRTVRAFDAQTGKELWRSPALESHPSSGITGSPIVAGEQLLVPLSSGEEGSARQDSYSCCSFRGSLAALDIRTGKINWQTQMITAPLAPIGRNAKGTLMQGPAGAAIWSAPTVDLKRGLAYVATGDSYTDAPAPLSDAIVAIDLKTGAIHWSNQVTAGDNYIMGCPLLTKSANCPINEGPDHDFGASPVLFTLKSGKQVLLSGQKSGVAYGMDPDTGRTLWATKVGAGSHLGGIEWGIAADQTRLFVPNADMVNLIDEALRPKGLHVERDAYPPARPGLSALDPATGRVLWFTPAPVAPCRYGGDRSRDTGKGACIRAQSAAISAMPGVVFSGTADGWFRAYDAATGKIVWAFSTTARTYDTVNQVKGQPGGAIDGLGPAIANGMIYTMSGFNGASNTGGNGVNVLLAFSVDGR